MTATSIEGRVRARVDGGDDAAAAKELVHPKSLGRTVDAINEAIFFDRPITVAERVRAARWIAGRRGLDGAYAGMFAPTPRDRRDGFGLFTGERLPDGA